MSGWKLVERDGRLVVDPPNPRRETARRNGLKGGRPKGSGKGRAPGLKRHLTAEGDDFLAKVRDEAKLKSHAEAVDLIRTLWGGRIAELLADTPPSR